MLTENLVRHGQGSYTLTATVADNRGNSDATTVTVTINSKWCYFRYRIYVKKTGRWVPWDI